MMITGEDLILIYGVFVFILLESILIFWNKTDIINKFKTYIWAGKGAKVFRLLLKDGTEEEFVECAKQGSIIKHNGDPYSIKKGTVIQNRAKNCPVVQLYEEDLESIDISGLSQHRIDVKLLRALLFAEREKAKSDLNPDVKLLKMLVIAAVICCAIACLLAYFNYDTAQKTLTALGPIANYYAALQNATAHGAVTL